VTNTNTPTQVYGNLGVTSLTSITNFPPGVVTGGAIHNNDAVAQQAQVDALAAYTTLAGLPHTSNLTGTDLGGLLLTPGVYYFSSSAGLTGTLTLDFSSDPTGKFVFQIGSTLITASGSSVNVINGGSLSGVYWQVGSSANLGAGTVFAGNILADDSITLTTGADILCGRAIALTGVVTLDDNLISNDNTDQNFGHPERPDYGSYGFSGGPAPVPEPPTMLLLGSGLAGLTAFRFRLGKGSKKA
jgi:type VI secretion system secreted protein VgrG